MTRFFLTLWLLSIVSVDSMNFEEINAWQKVWDHWRLERYINKTCRSIPCHGGCGVRCNTLNTTITGLALAHLSLSTTIPVELVKLASLEKLNIQGNSLHGDMPVGTVIATIE